MEPYLITLIVFFASFLIFPIFFLFPKTGRVRKFLGGLQIGFFAYWIIVFFGFFLIDFFYALAVPRGSDPEGSVYSLNILATPAFIAFIVTERIVLKRAAKRLRPPVERSGPIGP